MGNNHTWTAADDLVISTMLDDGALLRFIADALDRPYGAVRQHCKELGWTYNKAAEKRDKANIDPYAGTDRRPWTEKETRDLAEMWVDGFTLKEMGLELKRSQSAIQCKLRASAFLLTRREVTPLTNSRKAPGSI